MEVIDRRLLSGPNRQWKNITEKRKRFPKGELESLCVIAFHVDTPSWHGILTRQLRACERGYALALDSSPTPLSDVRYMALG
jgi:hypothetical protein